MITKINRKKEIEGLKKIYNEHSAMPFPEPTSNEELFDLKGELAYYGAFVVGLVSSFLENAPVNAEFVKVDLALGKRMQDFKPKTGEEKRSIQELIGYKKSLDNLLLTLAKIIN